MHRGVGEFFTHEIIGKHLSRAIIKYAKLANKTTIKIVEPFCGDGRLIIWLLESLNQRTNNNYYDITLWDIDSHNLEKAYNSIAQVSKKLELNVKVDYNVCDSFEFALDNQGEFDVCITNPPWENLKPDTRELKSLDDKESDEYIRLLKSIDQLLKINYPKSQPFRKFSGWGTNLSRCGAEASLRLINKTGICGIVLPASILADQMSLPLRSWLFNKFRLLDIGYFVAEARLFNKVDQPSICITVGNKCTYRRLPDFSYYDKDLSKNKLKLNKRHWDYIQSNDYSFPYLVNAELFDLLPKWDSFPRFGDLEGSSKSDLWSGRELDETGHKKWTTDKGKIPFIKGRMIDRYRCDSKAFIFLTNNKTKLPESTNYHRIIWRDVSRLNQKRRIQATIIPPGPVAGNSCHVAFFRDNDIEKTYALLGILSSLVFEAQLRSSLSTTHVSLGIVRKLRIPRLDSNITGEIADLVKQCLEGSKKALVDLEVHIALLYNLTELEFRKILKLFPKITNEEIDQLFKCALWKKYTKKQPVSIMPIIANHYSGALSELDMQIALSVPPGGNWKDIPETVPSQRIKQIRKSYLAGEGSRSTYYGRLRRDMPSYTINTYFMRPGNGSHLHYDYKGKQHRTLSQREAARLQSFPDSFVFYGNKSSINKQIGNAVPPLLAYMIAKQFPFSGIFSDLFSGAGGLSLGFLWAGWRPIVANDIEASFLETYRNNIHNNTILGDIGDDEIFNELKSILIKSKSIHKREKCFVLGGPPCQGFSTAGNKRSMGDKRNWLFVKYKEFIEAVNPDGFLFENVPGLLNMERGRVFEMIQSELSSICKSLYIWKLNSEEYGIPQRRKRVVIIGDVRGDLVISPPAPITTLNTKQPELFSALPIATSVEEAISDLPPLEAGEDGSGKNYVFRANSKYQKFMRSIIEVDEFIDSIKRSTS